MSWTLYTKDLDNCSKFLAKHSEV